VDLYRGRVNRLVEHDITIHLPPLTTLVQTGHFPLSERHVVSFAPPIVSVYLARRNHMGSPWRRRDGDRELAETRIVICLDLTYPNVGRSGNGGPHDLVNTFAGTGEPKRFRDGWSTVLIFANPVEQGAAIVSHRSTIYGEVLDLPLAERDSLASKLAVSTKSPASIAAKMSCSDAGIHIFSNLPARV
jgi:hypothetical protein